MYIIFSSSLLPWTLSPPVSPSCPLPQRKVLSQLSPDTTTEGTLAAFADGDKRDG